MSRLESFVRLEEPILLQVGQPAPAFTLPDADMEMFDLASVRGKHNLVLYFYPRDGTPACTRQAIDFSDHEDEFARWGSIVIGVSCDDCLTHAEFRDHNGVSIRLLSDTDCEVCRLYGVWQPKEVDGVKKMCILRSTFIIDSEGVVQHVLYGVTNPRGHAAEVLKLVQQLSRNQNANRQEHRCHPELSSFGHGRESH